MRKPVRWITPLSAPTDISGVLSASGYAQGEAFAIDNQGVIVGTMSGFSGNTSLKRPFSTILNGLSLTDDRKLPVVAGAAGGGEARSVVVIAEQSFAAGWVFKSDANQLAALWPPIPGTFIPGAFSSLGTLSRSVLIGTDWYLAPDHESQCLGVNSSLTTVGWSGGNQPSRAVVKFGASNSGSPWKDLNDAHYVSQSGWVLESANSISSTSVITGNGTLNGNPRGFLLVPRVAGN